MFCLFLVPRSPDQERKKIQQQISPFSANTTTEATGFSFDTGDSENFPLSANVTVESRFSTDSASAASNSFNVVKDSSRFGAGASKPAPIPRNQKSIAAIPPTKVCRAVETQTAVGQNNSCKTVVGSAPAPVAPTKQNYFQFVADPTDPFPQSSSASAMDRVESQFMPVIYIKKLMIYY